MAAASSVQSKDVEADDVDVELEDIGLTGLDFELFLDNLGDGRAGVGAQQPDVDLEELLDWETGAIARPGEDPVAEEGGQDLAGQLADGSRLLIPRPQLFVRLILLVLMVLLAVLALGGALVADAVGELVVAIRHHGSGPVRVVDQPLPGIELLLDDQRFVGLLERDPDRRPELLIARARALAGAGRVEAAIVTWQVMLSEAPGLVGTDGRLAYIAALVDDNRIDTARRALAELPVADLTEQQRAEMLALIGRLRLGR